MVYLDNAATTFPKPRRVIAALDECVRSYCGNPGRSSHRLSIKACEKIYDTRQQICSLLDFQQEEKVVFTQNATYALNLAIKTSIKGGEHIIISDLEHNSVIRPLSKMRERLGIEISVFNSDAKNLKEEIMSHIRPNTSFIVSTLASNVTGKEIPLSVLSEIRNEKKIKLIADASQLIGHKKISLEKTPCDILCAPGHKALFGIQGVGFAVFSDDIERDSFIEGGSGNESQSERMPQLLPERFEAGTLPTPSIVSLGEGIRYITELGLESVEKKIETLSEMICERILSVKGATLLSNEKRGVIPFNFGNVPSSTISGMLDKMGIYTRSGLHCAPTAHKKLGTLNGGAVRVSISVQNSKRDIEKFHAALLEISRKLN